jgi:histidine triad (HIT) family protein
MKDCLFCKIVKKEIESNIVYENEHLMVFKDISPVSPVHLLLVPKKHISSIMEIDRLKDSEVKEIMETIKMIAEKNGLDKKGFRVVTNMGPYGGQTVDHLHFHIMGKRKFEWPPG